MEHQLGHIHEQRRNEIADVLCRLIVAGVEGVDALTGGTVGSIEVVRTNGIGLQTNAEEFSLEAVLHPVKLLFHNLVE